jgi:hypothetical protein
MTTEVVGKTFTADLGQLRVRSILPRRSTRTRLPLMVGGSGGGGQAWMFARSSSRRGCFGSQPSACRVWVLEEGWSAAKITPRGP